MRRFIHARKDALANRALFRLLILPDRAVAALHVAVQRGFKHHHEGTIESVAQLAHRVSKHQTLFHIATAGSRRFAEWNRKRPRYRTMAREARLIHSPATSGRPRTSRN